jgi:hypothetical protein
MLDKLDFMVRFWDLQARHGAGMPLTPLERGELFSLLSLMVADDPMPDPGQAREEGTPVQIAAHASFLGATLVHVCAAGLVVVAGAPMPVGQSTVVRITDPGSDVEYTLPCVVAWAYVGTHTTLALRVDGGPTRKSFAAPRSGPRSMPLGRTDPAPVPAG